jgi:Domain of unknown function (DUF4032)/Lipopolysaccharide kinase (Kdo/WaaP) family
MRFELVADESVPDFLDLPWATPLEEWDSVRLVDVVRGIGRHVVRFVHYDGAIFALKEINPRLARREYRLLRDLAEHAVPVVEAVGVVSDRPGELDAVLITRHLDFSLPYRTLFSGHGVPNLREHLLDALAELLVRLHVAGFFWGDCSLSNALFRRDAGALSAYLVDAETGAMHPILSEGQRRYDLEIAVQNLGGELLDVAETGLLPPGIDPVETGLEVARRYEALWVELTREELIGRDERHRIHERLDRLHALGYDTDELELVAEEGGYRLRVNPRVVEPGYHQRRLSSLTALDVQENQARRLLDDLLGFREEIEREAGVSLPDPIVAYRWLAEAYEPAIAAIPDELRGKLEAAELYHQLLEHRWFRSEELGRCISMEEALDSYVPRVLAGAPDERVVPTDDPR